MLRLAEELVQKFHLGRLGVQSPWLAYTFISLPEGALDFKQYFGARISSFGALVEVQAARKLAAMYTLIVAA